MRTKGVGIFVLISVVAIAQENQPWSPSPRAQDGGVREVLESIVIPPIPNAPFSATLDTEWVKYTADGASITLVNERHIARDGRGRIYEERWWLVPKNSNVKSEMNWIQIADPKQRTLYNCSPQKHTCDLLLYDPAGDLTAAAPINPTQSARTNARGDVATENLGTRNIAGVDTVGVRVTTTMNPGTMGNDQPLTAIREYWHSQELGINLLSIRSGPMIGKQTFTVTELTSAEPDLQLFEVPAGYRVNDQRKNSPVSQ